MYPGHLDVSPQCHAPCFVSDSSARFSLRWARWAARPGFRSLCLVSLLPGSRASGESAGPSSPPRPLSSPPSPAPCAVFRERSSAGPSGCRRVFHVADSAPGFPGAPSRPAGFPERLSGGQGPSPSLSLQGQPHRQGVSGTFFRSPCQPGPPLTSSPLALSLSNVSGAQGHVGVGCRVPAARAQRLRPRGPHSSTRSAPARRRDRTYSEDERLWLVPRRAEETVESTGSGHSQGPRHHSLRHHQRLGLGRRLSPPPRPSPQPPSPGPSASIAYLATSCFAAHRCPPGRTGGWGGPQAGRQAGRRQASGAAPAPEPGGTPKPPGHSRSPNWGARGEAGWGGSSTPQRALEHRGQHTRRAASPGRTLGDQQRAAPPRPGVPGGSVGRPRPPRPQARSVYALCIQ